jgi:hypothetical protein
MTVRYKGKEYTLTSDPYVAHTCGMMCNLKYYEAYAKDSEDEEYFVRWYDVDWDCEDESDACDWEIPCEVETIYGEKV